MLIFYRGPMKIEMNEKRKGLLNIYWFLLIVLAVVSLVNLLAIAEDSLKTAAIINLIFLILIPIIFVLGYVDYRRFAPLTKLKEFGYCATAVVATWITLIHFNVQNYTFISDLTGESCYIPVLSVFVALYLAIAFISVILSCLNPHNRRKLVRLYYFVAVSSLISSIFLTAFNYGTYVSLFWATLRLIGITSPITVDTGMTVLQLRVVVEYCIFIAFARKEKKNGTLKKGEESEFRPELVGMFIAAIVFMLINILVLPLINTMALANYQYYSGYMLAYEIVEFLSVAVLLSLGTATAFISKKSEKFGVIYIRMGVAAIVFALVYLIMDFFPINDIIKSDNEIQAQVVSDVFHAIIKMLGLLGYTLYVALDKKLNKTLHLLDIEHEEATSSEYYHI